MADSLNRHLKLVVKKVLSWDKKYGRIQISSELFKKMINLKVMIFVKKI